MGLLKLLDSCALSLIRSIRSRQIKAEIIAEDKIAIIKVRIMLELSIVRSLYVPAHIHVKSGKFTFALKQTETDTTLGINKNEYQIAYFSAIR